MLFVVLCPGTPEGSTGSDSGFKASQKTGQRLKVSSDRLGKYEETLTRKRISRTFMEIGNQMRNHKIETNSKLIYEDGKF